MDILAILGIYEGDIDHAWEECQDALEEQGLSNKIRELEDYLEGSVTEIDMCDPTNSIIDMMMSECKRIIEDAHPGQEVNYYVNGYDSHIYPGENPQSVEGRLKEAGLSEEEIKEILSDRGFEHDLIRLFESEGDILVFESMQECGENNIHNGCRTDESDEEFCQFLFNNYVNNYSDVEDICIILESGRVVQASV